MQIDEADIAAMHLQGDLVEFLKVSIRDGRAAAERRRALILRHPDLAERLTKDPLNYTTPEHWNGSVPPETWREARNDSPRRPAILALLDEAQRREQQ